MSSEMRMTERETAIRRRLEGANVVPLAMSLAQLSGDLSLLERIAPHVRGAWEHLENVPAELAAEVRDRVAALLAGEDGAAKPVLPEPDRQTLRNMMTAAVGEPVDDSYVPMLIDHMFPKQIEPTRIAAVPAGACVRRVAIVGAGASGICAGITLGQMAIDYVVYEKNDDVGGTWYENRYPGCAVDTPNHFYQFSFEPNNEWPHYFSQQKSIQEYLSRCADKYEVRPHVRFGVEVTGAQWDDDRAVWTVTARDRQGRETSEEYDALICAVGQLNRPKIPRIAGLSSFGGTVLHTAAWPDAADLRGKRVALVGTGASAVQVGPAIADEVAKLYVLQRSGSWVARRPNIDKSVSDDKKWVLNHVPFYAPWYRFQLFWAFGDGLFEALKIDPSWPGGSESINANNAKLREVMLRHIHRELEGRPDLIDKVIPTYPPFGKRVLGDAGWYQMLRRENVELTSTAIEGIEPQGIRLASGEFLEVDAIVFATGFEATRMLWPMDIRGRSGKSIRDVWGEDDARAYLGITVPDFPNMFLLFGPNTNLGHGGSAIFLAECQMRYTTDVIAAMNAQGIRVAEVKPEVHDAYNADIDQRLKRLSWSHQSVDTWYKNAAGRIVTNQPWKLIEYWQLTRKARLDDYYLRQSGGKAR
ncbi:MAG: NAD(P)/FAD-dependent oxidoreductase [Burkholderiales bacterium]|nr:NAD(P)/FAD-dependent oxidoreductase [Burkholderiales bacterium]